MKCNVPVFFTTVSVPIEIGNTYIRNNIIGKKLSDEKIYEIVKRYKKYNLFTVGLFIMGFAEDTTSTLNDTLFMINKLNLDINGVNTLIPFPGTRVFKEALEKTYYFLITPIVGMEKFYLIL